MEKHHGKHYGQYRHTFSVNQTDDYTFTDAKRPILLNIALNDQKK